MSIITMLTDFGHSDEYVGVMKGVILSIDPDADVSLI
jgi:S-adenosyl-L-methionine hydrolase (adenosine-forming)